ncbi:MAG: branched-chain-amino-acid transaminase [Gemmatimonadaceae bacterium]
MTLPTAVPPSLLADDLGPLVWVDGKALPANAPHLSALDRGFTLADGLFETMRVYSGAIFRLEHHMARLSHGLAVIDLIEPTNIRQHLSDAVDSSATRGRKEAALRLTVSRGIAAPGLAPPRDPQPTVTVVTTAPPHHAPLLYERGITVRVVRGRRNEYSMTAGLKTLSYTESVVALAEARAAGGDDALMLDTEGHVSEAAASNVFGVVEGGLVTPPTACGVLPGITRAAVIELALGLGMRVTEAIISLATLGEAAEIFLTSSLRELVPVVRVNENAVGTGRPGPVTRRLMAAYGELIRRECSRQ